MGIRALGLSTDLLLDPGCSKKNSWALIFVFSKWYNPINSSQNFQSCTNRVCSFCVEKKKCTELGFPRIIKKIKTWNKKILGFWEIRTV